MPETPPHACPADGTAPAEPLGEVYARLRATGLIARLLELARDEDLHPGGRDLTSAAMDADADGSDEVVRADVVFREPGVAAGLVAIPDICETFGVGVRFEPALADGDTCAAGAVAGTLVGPRAQIVLVERTLLNLVGRLSGVATRTAEFVRAVEGTGATVCDTRKTTPGLRALEKYAVLCGGGTPHRFSLGDAVLIKDNHIAGVAGVDLTAVLDRAARRARTIDPAPKFVEVEVDTLDQLDAVLAVEAGLIDFVLLDNFTTDEMREACARREHSPAKPAFEASGGVTLETIAAIARTGVERISVGGLTHHAVSLDVGLDMAPERG
ncbi:MAG: nicotinate-nucleotide diphosphorylase (carboxylating) [Phycisphaeraceae bacterium]|nr:MAG: nicotinate-nucleotide diphosphorylase (carboxylating) [Phycisphaeraceae bacterium]